jgi:hypothetical protein
MMNGPNKLLLTYRERHGIVMFLMVGAFTIASSGCLGFRNPQLQCQRRANRFGTVTDAFERYVIVGYDNRLCCPIPGKAGPPRIISPGTPITVWVRAVYRDAVNKPANGVDVTISLVDSFGANVDLAQQDILVEPRMVRTGQDGYYFGSIVVLPRKPGHFRVKASYRDKEADAYSYGPSLIVQQ